MADFPPIAQVTIGADRVAKVQTTRARPYYSRGDTMRLTPDKLTIDPDSGATKVAVVFKTVLADVNWIFAGLTFWNNADADIDIVQLQATGRVMKSQAGFTVQLNGPPPTDNYYMDWAIAERYNP